MAKRYSLVRVDYIRPELFEKIRKNFVCVASRAEEGYLTCEKCLYGDTKEELIAKVEQVIKRESLKGAIWESDLAKEIVEFLGVEE